MTDYEILKDQSISLHAELEGLLNRKKSLANELFMLETRLKQVKDGIESNLIRQQIYWPNPQGPSEMVIVDDVYTSFMLNPDQTMQALSENTGVSVYVAARTVKKHLQKVS